jgi:uncharacterized protein with FMN-binding domain
MGPRDVPTFPRRAFVALATTAVALALLLSFKTPDATFTQIGNGASPIPVGPTDAGAGASAPPTDPGAGDGSGIGGVSLPPVTPAPAPTAGASSGGATGKSNGTFTGALVQTRYGNVQVQVTMKSGQITEVTALQLPTDGRSGRISQAVEPILHDEALQAQSAQIDMVSGATYTSQGYAQSLQAALDQAHA